MSEFVEILNTTLKPSLSFIDMEFAEFNESAIEDASLDFIGLPNDSLLPDHQSGFNMPYAGNLPSYLPAEFPTLVTEPDIKRKAEVAVLAETEASSANSFLREDKSKRRKKEREKPKEMVHVRARRGQATDSHSLAERVRRERINEKMRCLQDLVPGCYKTMGMATMLDEIINYVQSLQNQVEFLSMKLSAASSFFDFRLGLEAMEAPQQVVNAQDVDAPARDYGHGSYTSFMSTMPF